MRDLPPDERERALYAVAMAATHQGKGGFSEEEIADKAGFESVEHMRQQFAQWDLPSWLSGAQHAQQKHQSKRRPGAGSGRIEELPPAARAASLIRERLQDLMNRLTDLEHRREFYQDKRFVGADVYTDPVFISRCDPKTNRDIFSAEEWRELCERHGQSPDLDEIMVTDAVTWIPKGADPSPAEPLTTLIGVYALAGGEMEPLLEALHPGTPSEDALEDIRKRVEGRKKRDGVDGLKTVAQQLAQRVLGRSPMGSPPPSLSPVEHDAACYITHLREEGLADDAILAKLRNHRKPDGSRLTKEDVARLGNLRMRYP
jgi:hypothetical protein